MPGEIKMTFHPKILIVDDANWDRAYDGLMAKVAAEMTARLVERKGKEELRLAGIPELKAAEYARLIIGGCEHRWMPSALVPGHSFYCSKCRQWKVLTKKGNPDAR